MARTRLLSLFLITCEADVSERLPGECTVSQEASDGQETIRVQEGGLTGARQAAVGTWLRGKALGLMQPLPRGTQRCHFLPLILMPAPCE